jgi:hypothetical protein
VVVRRGYDGSTGVAADQKQPEQAALFGTIGEVVVDVLADRALAVW